MDVLSFLRADHESVLGMIESLERGRGNSAAELDARGRLATSLVIASSRHEAVEEQFFWPEVRRVVPDGDELADRAIGQEDAAKRLLQRIENSEPGERAFEQALTEVMSAIREHIEFEQSQVWPLFENAESAQVREALGEKMEQAERAAPTRPHPNTPSGSVVQKTAGLAAAVLDKVRDAVTGRKDDQPPRPPRP
ncbi:hemerythrin domain-containing protein [Nocardia ignorata]|uniref:Hemerythrin HHE cation binding domain-containing protein n=1 Tax=Nocardia ignorata TaxID=145285 RepID=A0A4V3CN67_NOCIG|nr:hemerythrin domain-containing protein [Nocardia ignorata]TDP32932.1 hemerythrin HHE cation binding domain-containing protein [Nocardia ignorata]